MAQQISAIEEQNRRERMRAAIRAAAQAIQNLINSFKRLFTGRDEQQGQVQQQRKQRPAQQSQQQQDKKAEILANYRDLVAEMEANSIVNSPEEQKQVDAIKTRFVGEDGEKIKALEDKPLNAVKAEFTRLEKAYTQLIDTSLAEAEAPVNRTVVTNSYLGGLEVLQGIAGEKKTLFDAEIPDDMRRKAADILEKFGKTEEELSIMDEEEIDSNLDELQDQISELHSEYVELEKQKEDVKESNKSEIEKVLDGEMSVESLGESMVEQNPQLAQQNGLEGGQDAGPSISM